MDKDKIEFDENTKANVAELVRTINALQVQLRTICQTVVYMNNRDPDEYTLASDLSGVVKIKKAESENAERNPDQ
jgi:hypothetical protein